MEIGWKSCRKGIYVYKDKRNKGIESIWGINRCKEL